MPKSKKLTSEQLLKFIGAFVVTGRVRVRAALLAIQEYINETKDSSCIMESIGKIFNDFFFHCSRRPNYKDQELEFFFSGLMEMVRPEEVVANISDIARHYDSYNQADGASIHSFVKSVWIKNLQITDDIFDKYVNVRSKQGAHILSKGTDTEKELYKRIVKNYLAKLPDKELSEDFETIQDWYEFDTKDQTFFLYMLRCFIYDEDKYALEDMIPDFMDFVKRNVDKIETYKITQLFERIILIAGSKKFIRYLDFLLEVYEEATDKSPWHFVRKVIFDLNEEKSLEIKEAKDLLASV